MAIGALSAARRGFADGGDADMSIGPPPEAAPAGRLQPQLQPAPSGALGDDFASQLAQGLIPGGVSGALTQVNANQQRLDAANTRKVNAIEATKNILAQTRANQTSNLPLMAFGAAMLQPTHTGGFAESLGNGMNAAIPQISAERQHDMDYALASGKLDIAASDADLARAQDSANDFMKRMQMVAQAGTWQARTQGAYDRTALTNLTRVQVAQMTTDLRTQLGNAKTETDRARIIANFTTQNRSIDERVRDDMIKEATNQQRANTSQDAASDRDVNAKAHQIFQAAPKDVMGNPQATDATGKPLKDAKGNPVPFRWADALKQAQEAAKAAKTPPAATPVPATTSRLQTLTQPPPAADNTLPGIFAPPQ